MDIFNSMAYFWIVIGLFFLLLEMGQPGLFFFISFFCGGLIAAVSSLWISSLIGQTALFFTGTMIALIPLRYFVMPFVEKNRIHERTNVYAVIGKRGFVLTHIAEKELGLVKINGVIWAARTTSGAIAAGNEVEVVDVRGAHVVVKKV